MRILSFLYTFEMSCSEQRVTRFKFEVFRSSAVTRVEECIRRLCAEMSIFECAFLANGVPKFLEIYSWIGASYSRLISP